MDMDEINKLLGFSGREHQNKMPPLPHYSTHFPEDNETYKIYYQFDNDEPLIFMEGLNIDSEWILSMDPKVTIEDNGIFLEFRTHHGKSFRLMCKRN
jgi:hypothetical protein